MATSNPARIVVVGASLAGLRAVETLRAEGYEGRLTLIGAEPHLPYDRPPLSKEILRAEWDIDRLELRRGPYEDLELDLRLGARADGVDVERRVVRTDDGAGLEYDRLLIATGAAARRIPALEGLEGVHYLRTRDDALAIRRDLAARPRVLVVGGGFIGAEVAASCRGLGLEVTLVEPLEAPLVRGIGAELGAVAAALHADHGVDVRCGVAVEGLQGESRVSAARLSDGSVVSADVVVIGVGALPVTDWLAGSGLRVDDGVVCDRFCRSSAPDVYAAGDVARWFDVRLGESVRLEHWDNAVGQGVYAARRMLGRIDEPYSPVPSFWSDQYDVKIQAAGLVRPGDEMRIVRGSAEARKLVALFGRGGRLAAVVTLRWPRQFIRYADLIEKGIGLDEAAAQV
jgi:NADPH-dependent 2,4-dienoyl-CoA reductase/sulfur reductase-like enzyme